MGISLKNWMGQRGLNKESAMSLLGMASATFYRHFNGEVGSTMDEKLIQIDGLVTQLAAYSTDGRQALNGMAEKRRLELLGTVAKIGPVTKRIVPNLILGTRRGPMLRKRGPVLRELTGNILVVGCPGSGHTRHLLIPNFEHFMGRLVVVDPRREITAAMLVARTKLTGRPCVVVDLNQEVVNVPATADVVVIGMVGRNLMPVDGAKAREVLCDIYDEVDERLPTLFWFDPMMNALGKEFSEDTGILDGNKVGAFICLGTRGHLNKEELASFGTILCLSLNDPDDGLTLGVFPKWWGIQSQKELLIIEGSKISPATKAVPICEGGSSEKVRLVSVVNGRNAEPIDGVVIDLPALVRLGDTCGGFYESMIPRLIMHAIKHQSLSDAEKIPVDVIPYVSMNYYCSPHLDARAFLDMLTKGSEWTPNVTLMGDRGVGSWPAQARLATAIMELISSKSEGAEKVLFSVETESGMSVSHRPLLVS